MKKILQLTAIVFLLFGCVNNSEEDLIALDCSESGLTILDISSIKSGCNTPGSISINVEGGESPYTYSIDGENFQAAQSFEGLVAGDFSIIVQDNIGCTAQTTFNLEAEDSGISLTLASENTNCGSSSGSITADASGGSGSLQFSIDDGDFGNLSTFSSLGAGEYTVSVKDEDGCVVDKSIIVRTDVSLSEDIMPIISSNCAIAGCHSGSVSPNLSTSSNVISNASRIKSETQSGSMPRGRTLSTTQIDLIACWVDDGANNN